MSSTLLPVVSMQVGTPPVKSKRYPSRPVPMESDVHKQSAYLAYHIVYFILKENGKFLNGYSNGESHDPPASEACLNSSSFKQVIQSVEKSCRHLKAHYNDDILAMVGDISTSDSQLHSDFKTALSDCVETGPMRWGKTVLLFHFTGSLATRLYREGQQQKIESLIGWLGMFLNSRVTPFIMDHGGWVSVYC